ncbi:MAG: EAL domain-containing protein [Campylobacterota bacterium]
MSKTVKIALVAGLFIATIVWNYMYKNSYDRYFSNYNERITQLKSLKDRLLHLNYSISQSVLFQYYNNDTINEDFARLDALEEKLLQRLQNKSGYEQTVAMLQQLQTSIDQKEKDVALLMQKNAKVKNSLSYLSTRIYELSEYKREFSDEVMQLVGYFYNVSNTLDYDPVVAKSRLESLQAFTFQDSDKKRFVRLLRVHAKLLIQEFPRYIQITQKVTSGTQLDLVDEVIEVFNAQSLRHKRFYDYQVLFIVLASLIALGVIVYFIFVTEKEKATILRLQKDYEKSLTTDPLTGLPNRSSFVNDIAKKNTKMQLVLLDLIGFSTINNIFGTKVGDHVLQEVAASLQHFSSLFYDAKLFRVGADQFGIVFFNKDETYLHEIADKAIHRLEDVPVYFEDVKVPITVNVGIATKEPHLINAQQCIKNLHTTFGQKVKIYDSSMDRSKENRDNIDIALKIKDAAENDGIKAYFQPIVDTQSKQIRKYEALVRLEDGDSVISPFFFLDIAKKLKLYNSISHTVIAKSIAMIRQSGSEVAINLSIEDILESKYSRFLYNILQENRDIAHKITFEIVESEQIENYSQLLEFIDAIKPYGCKIAIDDFGSGYSNFEHLFHLDVDFLKIDGSLIKNLDTSRNSQMIVKTILTFAKDAGIQTVAEFVHSQKIDTIVSDLGVDFGQGFYYGKPEKFI